MTLHDKNITIKPNEFVAIIKNKIFHSHSILDMQEFFSTNKSYGAAFADMIFPDSIELINLLLCNNSEKILEEWHKIQKENSTYIMKFYRDILIEEADFIIKPF